jgi:hypothetical protein
MCLPDVLLNYRLSGLPQQFEIPRIPAEDTLGLNIRFPETDSALEVAWYTWCD